eukprot:m.315235 g.315235  ORF g.315235 m.315235 type:complete len:188 (-) comp19674_c0_seq2:33-596(-)
MGCASSSAAHVTTDIGDAGPEAGVGLAGTPTQERKAGASSNNRKIVRRASSHTRNLLVSTWQKPTTRHAAVVALQDHGEDGDAGLDTEVIGLGSDSVATLEKRNGHVLGEQREPRPARRTLSDGAAAPRLSSTSGLGDEDDPLDVLLKSDTFKSGTLRSLSVSPVPTGQPSKVAMFLSAPTGRTPVT